MGFSGIVPHERTPFSTEVTDEILPWDVGEKPH